MIINIGVKLSLLVWTNVILIIAVIDSNNTGCNTGKVVVMLKILILFYGEELRVALSII